MSSEAINPEEVFNTFTSYQDQIQTEQALRDEIRDIVKELEQIAREGSTMFQVIHLESGSSQIPGLLHKSHTLFEKAGVLYSKLSKVVPANEYYKYHDHWRYVTQRHLFIIALHTFLETGKMVTREEAASKLSVAVNRSDGFHVDLEDYLSALLLLASELSRFAVNSVTAGDYSRPLQISNFVNQLHSGFRLLNFKNGNLRTRFDGLKYDVKKIEEVVYDLSIRGLKQREADKVDTMES